MERKKVIAILRFYRDADESVRLNEQIIKNLKDQYYITLKAVNMDGMPRGRGSASSPVEQLVLNIPPSVVNTIGSIQRENRKTVQIKEEIFSELCRLNYQKKAVIVAFYIDGLQWERISVQLNYSQRQCRNIRDSALDELGERFSHNKRISEFCFPKS